MPEDTQEVTAPTVGVLQDPKHPSEIKIRWTAGKGHTIKSWWLYIGSKDENGALVFDIVNGPMGKETEVLIPMERFARDVDVFIQVEGRINANDNHGHGIEVGILSDEFLWKRPALAVSAVSMTAAHQMKTAPKEMTA
jgi:hypothetical protein